MTLAESSESRFQVNRRMLLGGGLLMGLGSALWLAGAAVGMSAVTAGVRRYVQQMDVPPRELARRRWVQAVSAASAGANAWRSNGVRPGYGAALRAGEADG